MSTSDTIVERLRFHYDVITMTEIFARAFVGNMRTSKLRYDEQGIIERDLAIYKTERRLPVYVTRAFEAL